MSNKYDRTIIEFTINDSEVLMFFVGLITGIFISCIAVILL